MKFLSVASKLFSGKLDYTIQEGFVACIFFFAQKEKKTYFLGEWFSSEACIRIVMEQQLPNSTIL